MYSCKILNNIKRNNCISLELIILNTNSASFLQEARRLFGDLVLGPRWRKRGVVGVLGHTGALQAGRDDVSSELGQPGQGAKVGQAAPLNVQRVRRDGSRVSQEQLDAVLAGGRVLVQLHEHQHAVAGDLRVPRAQADEEVGHGGVVARVHEHAAALRAQRAGGASGAVLQDALEQRTSFDPLHFTGHGVDLKADGGKVLESLRVNPSGPLGQREVVAVLGLEGAVQGLHVVRVSDLHARLLTQPVQQLAVLLE